MKKIVLAFIFLSSIFITNASEETSAENTSALLKMIATEVDPNQAQKKLRIFLRGDEDRCVELFQQAVKEENPVAQLHLAGTYFAMNTHQDGEKDFKQIKKKELESYEFASYEFNTILAVKFLKKIHAKINPSSTWLEQKKIAYTIVKQAEERGSMYAKFIQILENRFNPSLTPLHFGTACKLKPLINQIQFPELLFTFGISLFNSYHSSPELGLEGLKYMEQSGFLDLHFFEKSQSPNLQEKFEEYCSRYVNNGYFKKRYYDAYGMRFVGQTTILIPSKEHWEKFKKEKLDSIQPSPDSFFDLFEKHDMEKITASSNKHGLDSISSTQGNLECISIHSFTDRNGYKRLGKIKMDTKSKNISIDMQLSPEQAAALFFDIEEELILVIDFLRDALFRCESSNIVVDILRDLR